MMRQVVNFFLTGLVLWVAAQLFPTYVQIDGWATLVLATLLIYVVGSILALGVAVSTLAMTFLFNSAMVTVVVCVAIFAFMQLIALMLLGRLLGLLSYYLSGFTVVGFWPKVLLALAISILTISAPKQPSNRYPQNPAF